MSAPDEDLIPEAVSGNADALRALLQRHAPAVRQRISGKIAKRWQSLLSEDDVMQQTYADAVSAIHRFVSLGEGSFRGWLSSLATCNLRDAIKMLEAAKRGGDRGRIDVVAVGDSYVTLLRVLSADGTSPSRQVARGEAHSALEQAVEELPDVYRSVVRMYDLEGKDVSAVAEALERSPGAVYMLRSRAHERLRTLLGATGKFFTNTA